MSNFVNLLDIIYPVGSMYFSTSSVSPASSVGGTWTQIKDAVLAASGNSYSGAVNAFHGNKAMTVDQMPSHTHIPTEYSGSVPDAERWEYVFYVMNFDGSGKPQPTGRYGYLNSTYRDIVRFCSNFDATAGRGQNYIPYHYSINVWKRTA